MEHTKNNEEINNKNIKRLYPLLISIAITTIFFIITYFAIGMSYYINDDRTIMDNISGKYTGQPSHYGIFISQILCQILKLLYKINPSIPFYGIILVFTMWLSCVIVCYNLIKDKENIVLHVIYLLSFIFIFLFFNIVNIQFTVVAIFPICAVISLIFSFPKKKSLASILLCSNIFIMSFINFYKKRQFYYVYPIYSFTITLQIL